MYDEELTLADVMEAVDEYLLEKSNFDRYIDKKADEEEGLRRKYDKYSAIATNTPLKKIRDAASTKRDYTLRQLKKKQSESGTFSRNNDGSSRKYIGPSYISNVGKASRSGNNMNKYTVSETNPEHPNNHGKAGGARNLARGEYINRANKKKAGATNTKLAIGDLKAGRYLDAANAAKGLTKESVDDLRLRVYEAAEAGLIDNDEKSTMLEYLNLDNYE